MLETGLRRMADGLAGRPTLFFVVLATVLLWPMLLNGGPYYFGDSPGYLNGGKVAVHFAGARLHDLFAPADQATANNLPNNVNGVRSVAYSVFAYVTCAPGNSWLGTCALQALTLAFVLSTLFKTLGLFGRPMALLGFAALTVFATPAAWFAVYGTPDIFAGVAILCVGLLVAYPDRLSLRTKIVFAVLIGFTVCAHLSHIPLVAALVAIAGAVLILREGLGGWKKAARPFAWIAVSALIGLAVTVSINAIGFKKASVTGNHYPIVLASSIQAGPARWYLESHCASEHYAICELYTSFPTTSDEFLWGKTGVRARATAEMAERIRLEEPVILKRAFAAYPLTSMKEALFSSFRQTIAIGIRDHWFGARLERDAGGNLELIESRHSQWLVKNIMGFGFELMLAAAVAAMVSLAVRRRDRLNSPAGGLLLMVVSGCLVNAAICGALSAVADRYQGRVIWVFIVCVAIVWWQSLPGKTLPKDAANAA
jgi:hypothetical protein